MYFVNVVTIINDVKMVSGKTEKDWGINPFEG
jgi:hypothetical protein